MRYNVKKFKNIVKLQAQYSGAKKKKEKRKKDLISSPPLLTTRAPKDTATLKSTGELKLHQSQG
jgi:hypothetical protein